jgi:phosphomethylpyrimidine synthase
MTGRDVRPEDNGFASGERLTPEFPGQRENLGRKASSTEAMVRDGESFGAHIPAVRHAGIRPLRRSRAAARSSPATSTTPNSSR